MLFIHLFGHSVQEPVYWILLYFILSVCLTVLFFLKFFYCGLLCEDGFFVLFYVFVDVAGHFLSDGFWVNEAIFAIEIVFLCLLIVLFANGLFMMAFLLIIDEYFRSVLTWATTLLPHSSMLLILIEKK